MAGRCSTSCRVISQEIPPWPTMIPALSTVTGTPASAEQALDLTATAQMLGKVVSAVTQPSEIDHAVHIRLRRGLTKRGCCRGIRTSEVSLAQLVHEVVRHHTALHGCGQRCGISDVPSYRFANSTIVLRLAGHRDHLVARCEQCRAQLASHETSRARHQNSHFPSGPTAVNCWVVPSPGKRLALR